MTCLLTAATAREIVPFLEHWKQSQKRNFIHIDVLITGIGLTAASHHITRQLYIKRPDLVIQAGVGGCFNAKISLGSVVVVKQETIADQSVIEMKKLKTLFDLKLVPHDQYPFKKGWLVNPYTDILKKTQLKPVKGISVNEITTDKQKIKFYKNYFKPVVESMEGAALHYVCLMENVPFVQLRSISNYIGERDKRKWDLQKSVANLNDQLIRFVETLNEQYSAGGINPDDGY